MKQYCVVCLFFFLFFLLTFSNANAYFNIETVNDAYIWELHKDSTYNSGYLWVGSYLDGTYPRNERAFISFNISTLPTNVSIDDAILYMRIYGLSSIGWNVTVLNVYNTTGFNESTVTWNNQPALGTLQDNKTILSTDSYKWINFSVTDALKTAYGSNSSIYFAVKTDKENYTGVDFYSFGFYAHEAGAYMPYLLIYTSGGEGCWEGEQFPLGTTCADSSNYRTNLDNCHVTLGSCPSGTLCTAFTPVINATPDIGLVENWTGCSLRIASGANIPCTSVCYNNYLLYSNCQGYTTDPECLQCPDANGGFYRNSVYGYYTKGWYSNQSTFSASGNTIGCFNPITSVYDEIINTIGNITTEIGILTQAGNNITEVTTINNQCLNTSTVCYDASCNPVSCYIGNDSIQVARQWVNARLGTPFGADLVSLIASGIISIWIFINSKEKKIEVLLAPFLLIASACSFIGFLTTWFLVLNAGLLFVLIFWKVKQGG